MIYKIKRFLKWYCNPYLWIKPYFLSFVEETVLNENYRDYIGGRLELWTHWAIYNIDEFRFFTKDIEAFYKFRDKWDFKCVNWFTLQKVKKYLKQHFYERVN